MKISTSYNSHFAKAGVSCFYVSEVLKIHVLAKWQAVFSVENHRKKHLVDVK